MSRTHKLRSSSSQEQTCDRTPTKALSSCSNFKMASSKRFEVSNVKVKNLELKNPDPNCIFEEASPSIFLSQKTVSFKPSALEIRLNKVLQEEKSCIAPTPCSQSTKVIPPKAPFSKDRFLSIPKTPLLPRDLEGYDLLPDYSFSKDTSGLILVPMGKRYSLQNPCNQGTYNIYIKLFNSDGGLPIILIDKTESDIFELSEIDSRV